MKEGSHFGPRSATNQKWTALVSKTLSVTLVLLWAGSICRGDEPIGTTNGTYTLSDVNSLASAAARQSANRTAQLALADVSEDAANDEKELAEAEEKIAAHNKSVEQLNKDLDDYKTALNAYNAKLTPHNTEVVRYSSEVADQRAQVAKSNSLPPRQRSQVTVNRLNQWKARLDKKQTALNKEKEDLDAQKAVMDQKQAALNTRSQTVNDEAQQLNSQKAAMKVKLEEAYRRLKVCYDYSVQLKEALRNDGVETTADDQQSLNNTLVTLDRLKKVGAEASENVSEKASFNSGVKGLFGAGTPKE
jgi:chromosome segregation ATPase